ncbi:MAG: TlpA family protein disulfide reductase [bacterium]
MREGVLMFRVTRLLVYFLLTVVVTFLTVFATSSLSADESDQEMTPIPMISGLEMLKKGDKGLQVVGIAIDGSPMKGAIEAFMKQENFTFTVLIDQLNPDESFKVSDPYRVAGTPTLYIIDSEWIVKFANVGRTTREKLVEALNSIL